MLRRKVLRSLPPDAPLVGGIVYRLLDARGIQLEHAGVRSVHFKDRDSLQPAGVGHARLGEAGDELLQRQRDVLVDLVARVGGVLVEEGVRDVLAVQGGRDGEDVREGLVVVRAREVEGVAVEDALGNSQGCALELIAVALGAIEDGRVELRGDQLESLVGDSRQVSPQILRVVVVGPNVRRREDEALVGVVADHDAQAAVEFTLQQELARQIWHEPAIHCRPVCEGAVGGIQTDLDDVGLD